MKVVSELAKDIAVTAHLGQFRRDRKTPYINHPLRVADRLHKESDYVIAAGWLHDVIEDTEESEESLLAAGIPERVVRAVVALTKRPGAETYDEYLSRVAFDEIARKVKIADLIDNLADSPSPAQLDRYSRALNFLVHTRSHIPENIS